MIETDERNYNAAKQMNNEWSRFQSFIKFPEDSVVMPLRLAQAGFFYSGSQEEVICFCCGLKNDTWTADESVINLHKRLSPYCNFIYGDDTDNIAIHGPNKLTCDSVSNKGNENDKKSHCCEENCSADENDALRSHAKRNEMVMTKSLLTNEQVQRYPGIFDEGPKHPDYAMERSRLTSFTEWTAGRMIKPSDLAKAGFFYAGFGDCVRCFFCDGGLKNWEYEEEPWIEHARWFPACAFVKLCKGNTFVNICSAAINTGLTGNDDVELGEESIPEDWLIESINSPAAKLVLAKGYSQQDVEKAALYARQTYGSGEVKVQYIMEYLQDTNAMTITTMPMTSSGESISDNTRLDPDNIRLSDNSADVAGLNSLDKQSLLEENRKLKNLTTCKICMDNDACVAFLPCGHLASCVECAKSLRKCAVCRAVILGTVRVYQA